MFIAKEAGNSIIQIYSQDFQVESNLAQRWLIK
jgi:hypothetical protein